MAYIRLKRILLDLGSESKNNNNKNLHTQICAFYKTPFAMVSSVVQVEGKTFVLNQSMHFMQIGHIIWRHIRSQSSSVFCS